MLSVNLDLILLLARKEGGEEKPCSAGPRGGLLTARPQDPPPSVGVGVKAPETVPRRHSAPFCIQHPSHLVYLPRAAGVRGGEMVLLYEMWGLKGAC